MKYLFIGFIFYFNMVSCTSIRINNHIDLELKPYIDRYNQYCDLFNVPKAKTDNNEINLILTNEGFDEPSEIGFCNILSHTIYMRESYFNSFYVTNKDREIMILHELGHCILWRNHDERHFSSEKRKHHSLMYPFYDFPDYNEYKLDYLKEFFEGRGRLK